MKVIAVDIASRKKQAFSVWEDGKLVEVGSLPLGELFSKLEGLKGSTLAVEVPYLGKSPRTLIRLAETLGALIGAAAMFNLKLVKVYPSSWQSKILPIRPHTKRKARLHWAEVIGKALAKEYLGREDLSQDEATAVCIGQFISTREKYRPGARKGKSTGPRKAASGDRK